MLSLVVLAVASVLVIGADDASRPLPHADLLVLDATGRPVSTTFDTSAASTYTITVSGLYTYDGTAGLGFADCGHKDPEDETAWVNWQNVLVDGQAAACSSQPFSPAHSYRWTQQGTGAPFRFQIFANAFAFDDTGCLLVSVSEVAVPAGPPGSGPVQPSTCWRLTAAGS